MAGGGEIGPRSISGDRGVSEARTLWTDLPDASRRAVSIPSNIAEGKGHRSDGDFGRFLFHARGSFLDLQTQIVIAQGLEYPTDDAAANLTQATDDLGRGLNGLIQSVRGTFRTFALANDE